MTAQTATVGDRAPRSIVAREYRVSLALLLAGVVLLAVVFALSAWANSSSGGATSFSWMGLFVMTGGAAGGLLILLAGTVAYYHRSFLRRNPPGT